MGLSLASDSPQLALLITTVMSLTLFSQSRGFGVSDAGIQFFTWAYLIDKHSTVVGFYYPPLLLWVGLVVCAWSSMDLGAGPSDALLESKFTESKWIIAARRSDRSKAGRSDYRRRQRELWRTGGHDALENLRDQLRERGHAGLFRESVRLRVGFGLLGALLVVVTSLLAPRIGMTGIGDVRMGVLYWICLATGGLAVVGLLLAFPYGRLGERVIVDALGNVRSADEPDATQPPPPTVQT
jgi:hypothetical protein